jgi:hypothetical protein
MPPQVPWLDDVNCWREPIFYHLLIRMNIQRWTFLGISEKIGLEKLHEKLLKMFSVELHWGKHVGFHCPLAFGD